MSVFIGKVSGDSVILNPEESFHCCKVLRKKTGDTILATDGVGYFFECTLERVTEKLCEARIVSKSLVEKGRNYYLHIAIAPTKQIDRTEWFVEKAVELGIDEISFIRCKNSERTNIKPERMQAVVLSAVKQSKQAYIPTVNTLVKFEEILKTESSNKLIAYCGKTDKIELKNIKASDEKYLILIGPEGDFSPDEIALAQKHNFNILDLGLNRLRTETAALYIVSAFKAIF